MHRLNPDILDVLVMAAAEDCSKDSKFVIESVPGFNKPIAGQIVKQLANLSDSLSGVPATDAVVWLSID